jgi:hypothetical protein
MFSIRTQIARCLVAATVLVPAVVMNGCNNPAAPPQQPQYQIPRDPGQNRGTTTIAGNGFLRAGSAGNLGNSMAAVYSSLQEWANYMPVAFVAVDGSGAQVSFAITQLVAGTYYLDIWKDSDNSQNWTVGDFVGWFGNGALGAPLLTPFQVLDGQTRSVGSIRMYQIGIDTQATKVANDR